MRNPVRPRDLGGGESKLCGRGNRHAPVSAILRATAHTDEERSAGARRHAHAVDNAVAACDGADAVIYRRPLRWLRRRPPLDHLQKLLHRQVSPFPQPAAACSHGYLTTATAIPHCCASSRRRHLVHLSPHCRPLTAASVSILFAARPAKTGPEVAPACGADVVDGQRTPREVVWQTLVPHLQLMADLHSEDDAQAPDLAEMSRCR